MDRGEWLLIGALVALLVFGGGWMAVKAKDRAETARFLRDAFRSKGLPEEWGEALGRKESDLDPSAVNLYGSDGERGGAWGPTQITAVTARAFGYTGPMERLIEDTRFAAKLTADMVAIGFAERHGETYFYGEPDSIEQLGAVWNGGRASDDPNLPRSTRFTYIPSLIEKLMEVST